ncbi:MAG TPA: PEGA domain-containing protein [Polyangiaceae bacterium]|nr:PEGA domain-containing protein [Polyangiaceae bacterium]
MIARGVCRGLHALRAFAALLALAGTCLATEPGTPAARQHYLAGAQLYAQGKYSDAVDQFLAADRIAPSAALSYDIARAYEKLGETSLALRWYRDYLRRAGEPADAPKVRGIVQSLEHQLRNKGVQQVTVRSVPRGATVAIDGEPAGVTPLTTDLPPGTHHLTLTHEGYEKTERSFTLSPELAEDVDVRLARATTPEGAPAPVSVPPPESATSAPAASTSELPPAPREAKSPTLRTVGIVGMSVGGAALGGALAFEILRHDSVDDAKKDKTQIGYASKLDAANDQQTAARVLLGVGAGLAVTGGVLFFVGNSKREQPTQIGLACDYVLCGARASGRF